jgi:hypothetical protein
MPGTVRHSLPNPEGLRSVKKLVRSSSEIGGPQIVSELFFTHDLVEGSNGAQHCPCP